MKNMLEQEIIHDVYIICINNLHKFIFNVIFIIVSWQIDGRR